jgi:glycine oxidase
MSTNADVLIIGGGVIGLTIAYHLARAGARVTVMDRGDFGREASWAGAGIIPPGDPRHSGAPLERLRAHSSAMFPGLSQELRERTGIDNGYLRSGGIEVWDSGHSHSAGEWCPQGAACEEISSAALRALEPGLAQGFRKAYLIPGMAQVRNPRHLKALIAACAGLGVELRPGSPCLGLEVGGNRVRSVLVGQERASAAHFVLAAGAWADSILHPLGWRLGVKPVRGQIALLNTRTPLVRHIILHGSCYLVPRPDGRVLVGSTEEDAGFDKRTTAVAIADLLALAVRLVPGLAMAQVECSWAGLRPGSPDGSPYLGKAPGLENLFVAAGHFRSGIQLSAVTGLLMKELILGEPITIPLDAFRVDRCGEAPAPAAFRT